MRLGRAIGVALLLMLAVSSDAFAGTFVASPADGVRDRWIVLLEDSSQLPDDAGLLPPVEGVARALLARFGNRRPFQVYQHAVRGFAVELPVNAARALARMPGVAAVEQDRAVKVQAPPCPTVLYPPASTFPSNPQSISCPVFYSDNNCGDNWGLDRIDQQNTPLNGLHYFGNTGAGAHIYFLDTGLDYTHSEFKNAQGVSRVGTSINFGGSGTSQTDPYLPSVNPSNYYDAYGHGTHVTAAAAGLRYGVAKSATIHVVRVTNNVANSSTSMLTQGVDWIASNHVDPAVVNISMNLRVDLELQEDPAALTVMETAFRNLVNNYGIAVINSAGNFNIDAYDFSPTRVSELFVVGATDYYDGRWRETSNAFETCNFNETGLNAYRQCGSNVGASVDMWAPGAFITSAFPGGGTCRLTGTSLAAPLVTGVAATYLSANPTASPAALAQALINNATTGVLDSSTLAGSVNRLI